jgi:cyclopropane-fatty-acyl-phospholipid synthase
VEVTVANPMFYSELAFGGSIGAGESYMAGDWHASDLTDLGRILLRNRPVLDGFEGGLARLTAPTQRLLHRLHRNTAKGSRRNIAAHYDTGNDFFALVLDETLMYSSAVFTKPSLTLYDAQLARLRLVCEKLDLRPTDHVLEIGTGWGGFAIYAAQQYGCRITTTTISKAQYDMACRRIASAGLQDRITVLESDYRALRGRYDKLVSLEMVEAVGHQYIDTYFRQCSALLSPDGLMLLQAITISDQRYETAKDSVDFIKRHIFPGSCIPSVTSMTASITRATDMRIVHLEDIGPHYATTVRAWRHNLIQHRDRIRALGYSNEFLRMWEFYLCYCEAGFLERAVSDVQIMLAKPENRRDPILWCSGSSARALPVVPDRRNLRPTGEGPCTVA